MAAHRQPALLRLTKFFGKLFLINFAIGVVTGIVQEFQFGMNWSDYSRFVGDIFGAPLAIEGLLAFFLESTFLGLWIFGWDKLPGSCTARACGSCTSARSCRRTSSWPRTRGCSTPSGYSFNPDTGRAELDDFMAVLTNSMQLVTFPHTITAGVPDRWRVRGRCRVLAAGRRATTDDDRAMYRSAVRIGVAIVLVARHRRRDLR